MLPLLQDGIVAIAEQALLHRLGCLLVAERADLHMDEAIAGSWPCAYGITPRAQGTYQKIGILLVRNRRNLHHNAAR